MLKKCAVSVLLTVVLISSRLAISKGLHVATSHGALQGNNAQPLYSSGDSYLAMPKIIHQTWKTHELPPNFKNWSDSWRECMPDWELRIYDDADNRKFVEKHFPELLEMYDAYPEPIFRADAIRYMYLAVEGGLYVDLDIECLRDPVPLLEGTQSPVVLASERGVQISNSFMFSTVGGRDFFRRVAQQLPQFKKSGTPLDATGPVFITKASESLVGGQGDWKTDHDGVNATRRLNFNGTSFAVVDDKFVFAVPYHPRWMNGAKGKCLNRKWCIDNFPEAVSVSHWTGSWKKGYEAPKPA